jgi:deoxycytidylate deaminase
MQHDLKLPLDGVSRRHLVAGALGAVALPIFTPALGRSIEAPATEADERFMRIALEEAALGDDPYFFGAVIVREGEVLARGRNLWNQQQDPTAHGEMVAIRRFLAEHGMRSSKEPRFTLQVNVVRCAWARSCGAASPAWYTARRSRNWPQRWGRS